MPILIEEITPYLAWAVSIADILFALTLTIPTALLLRWLYQRSVGAAMLAHSNADSIPSPVDAPESSTRPAPAIGPAELQRRMFTAPRRMACVHLASGLAFGLTVTSIAHIANPPILQPFHPIVFLTCVVLFSWPTVFSIALIATTTASAQVMLVLAYLLLLVAINSMEFLVPIYSIPGIGDISPNPFVLIRYWALYNLVPTIALLLALNRKMRSIAPLVLCFLAVACAGVATIFIMAFYRGSEEVTSAIIIFTGISPLVFFILLAVGAFIGASALGWLALAWIRRGYVSKSLSDQSIMLDAIWLLFGTYYSIYLLSIGPVWSLAGIIAFLVYKLVTRAGTHLLMPRVADTSLTLLFLRVFSLGGRSEKMFATVAHRWRYVGNIQFVTGTDLASTTVQPHQFLEYISGRLHRLFVTDNATLDERLQSDCLTPDSDSRYRVDNFFCYADNWQMVVRRLVRQCDVALMDLRSFSKDKAGCIVELEELINTLPVERLVLMIDKTTDQSFLTEKIAELCQSMRTESPNRMAVPGDVTMMSIGRMGKRDIRRLLHAICRAAVGKYSPPVVEPRRANVE